MKKDKGTKDIWNPSLYDQKHSFVSKFGNSLIQLLDPKTDEKILDLGCGTGDLAFEISRYGTNVIGVDKSENMVAVARTKYPNIPFFIQDVVSLEFDREFDAVFSNATLHWVKTPKKALQQIYHSLKTGGRFIAEFGGKDNVQTISNEIILQIKENGFNYEPEDFPWYYPSIGEYTTLMEEAGFRVTFAQHFDRPTILEGNGGLRSWINMFGSSFFGDMDISRKQSIILEVEKRLKESLYQDNNWIADYRRIRVIGIKE